MSVIVLLFLLRLFGAIIFHVYVCPALRIVYFTIELSLCLRGGVVFSHVLAAYGQLIGCGGGGGGGRDNSTHSTFNFCHA